MHRFIGLAAVIVALAAAFPATAQDKPILAVMEIEDKTGKFERKDLQAATEYLLTFLVSSGHYSVVERGRQEEKRKEVIRAQKRESHDPCYDDKCRIELGRALAADTLLVCSIIGMGDSCTMSCRMVPLEKEVADKGALAEFKCNASQFGSAVKAVATQLVEKRGSATAVRMSESPGPDRVAVEGKSEISWLPSRATKVHFARTETTVRQYAECLNSDSCSRENHGDQTDNPSCNMGHSDRLDHPMNCVSAKGASAFCKWVGGRLPDEEEWYAEASNQALRAYPWGDQAATCVHAIMSEDGKGCGIDRTWPACSRPKGNSVSGVCDLAGNVWEWTRSWGPGKKTLGVRGGSWFDDTAGSLRADSRHLLDWETVTTNVGFRCVLESR